MGTGNIKNYFSTGELSNLCNIPRKTLLFYDKLGIIKPEIIDNNGYRYYKRSQVFLLQLIITLRQFDIPLHDIQNYINTRTPNKLQNILEERKIFYQQQIDKQKCIINNIDAILEKHIESLNIPYDTIMSIPRKEEYLRLSKPINEGVSFKNRTIFLADLFQEQFPVVLDGNHFLGYLLDANSIITPSQCNTTYFYFPITQMHEAKNLHIKKAGLYLTIYFKGVYMHKRQHYLEMLHDYCKLNKITPLSDVYVTSLQNYWSTENTEEYIYKMETLIK